MAPFVENTQSSENRSAEFAHQKAIEDWKLSFQPTFSETADTNQNGFTSNSQTSTENEPRQSLIEELLPYFRRKTVENELRGYLRLEKGWDGINSVPAPELAVQNAISFLALFPYDLKQPTPMVAADGEVGLYWRHENATLELEFAGDGVMFGYGCNLQGNEAFFDDVPVDSCAEMEEAIATATRIVAEFPRDHD